MPPQPGIAMSLAEILAPLCGSKAFRALLNAITFSLYSFDPKHGRKLTEGNQHFNLVMWQFISKSAYPWVWMIKNLASGKNIYRSLFPALELEKNNPTKLNKGDNNMRVCFLNITASFLASNIELDVFNTCIMHF